MFGRIAQDLWRRRVPHFFVGYLAATWAVIEAVDWVVARYTLSSALVDIALVALLSMIPTVVMLAYFHGGPGAQTWSRVERIGVPVNLLAAAALIVSLFSGQDLSVGPLGGAAPGVMPEAKHVAVLSFSNIGGEAENQALADGLVEVLTSKLSQLEQFAGAFWVVPASEVRGSSVTTALAAHQLFGANIVITGSLQRFANRLRVTMNVIDAISRRQLASRVIDEPLTSGPALQDKLVVALVKMLNVELRPESRNVLLASASTAPGAYEFYLQGRGTLLDHDRIENIDSSIQLFQRALEADSTFAEAYAGLAEAYLRKFQATREPVWLERAEGNSRRALERNDLLASVHITRGLVYSEIDEDQKALTEFQRALEIDPTNAEAYRGTGGAFAALGQLDRAEDMYRKSIGIKPDYWGGYNDLGVFYFRHGRYEDAARQFRHVIELTPQRAKGYSNLGGAYVSLNRRSEAIEVFKKALELNPSYVVYANLATLYFLEGRYEEAAAMYERALEIRDSDHRVWGYLASAYTRLEPSDEIEGKLQNAYRQAARRAEEQFELKPNDPSLMLSLAAYYVQLDRRDSALALVERAASSPSREPDIMFRIGHMYEQLDDRAAALRWIERALTNGYPVSDIESQPVLADLRNDGRYQSILQKLLENDQNQ